MNRFAITCLSVLAFGWIMLVHADEPKATQSDDSKSKDDKSASAIQAEGRENQQILERRFKDFQQSLLRLAQRLEKSTKPEDRQRADTLKKAIELVGNQGVDLKFSGLIEILKKNSSSLSIPEIKEAMDQNKMLAEDIRAILALLMADNRDDYLNKEIKRLMELIKQLDKVIREEKLVRAKTEGSKVDKDTLGKEQKKVTTDTEKIAKAMDKDADGKGDKSKGEPKDGKDGKGGQGQGGQGQSGDKKDKPKDDANPNDPNKPADGSPGRKQVQDANQYQKQAEDEIKKDKKEDASKKQSQAIAKLEEARRKLEEILRQLREEEIERLLAKLEQRCRYMLAIQIEVYDGTVRVDKAIGTNPDKKASRAEEQRALQLSDREEVIVVEANKAIQLLEAEGSAVAFPQMFEQVRDDAKNVARRLGKADVGTVTQVIEQDIIAALKDMIEALKKAQQDLKGGQGQQGPPQNQKLIDLLAELKMIRAMQVRVNSRTKVYGQQYTGEQAEDSDIQRELNELAQRQLKIFDATNNIAKGKNQ
jgi:hypothetical protein